MGKYILCKIVEFSAAKFSLNKALIKRRSCAPKQKPLCTKFPTDDLEQCSACIMSDKGIKLDDYNGAFQNFAYAD